MKAIITVDNLSKRYTIGKKEAYGSLRDEIMQTLTAPFRRGRKTEDEDACVWALKDVSFEVKEGEVLGIIGRNGAGKSTLLKILSRITEPTSGRVTMRGRVASLLEVGTGFHPELTGRENILLNGALLGMTHNEIKSKFDEIVAFAEIEKFLDTPVKRYSSGMYVRLAFAVAAHLEPEILVIDEVLAVGDAGFQKKCLGKMGDVAKGGRTVLFVSHNMGAVSVLCSKCILLKKGKVEEFDSTQKVISQYNKIEHQDTTVKIDPSMRQRGEGLVDFKECTMMNISGEPSNTFLIGEDVRVEIVLESRYTGSMSFWLIIFDSMGRPLLSTHQRDVEMSEISDGVFRLSYTTRNMKLMPGFYTVTAGAFTPNLDFLEWIDGCQAFEVLPCFLNGSAYDGRWGAMDQDAVWSLSRYE